MKNLRIFKPLTASSVSPFRTNINLHKMNVSVFRPFVTSIPRKASQTEAQSLKSFKDKNTLDLENYVNPKDKYKPFFELVEKTILFPTILAIPYLSFFQAVMLIISQSIILGSLRNILFDTESSLENLSLIRRLSEGKDITVKMEPSEVREKSNKIFKVNRLYTGAETLISDLLKDGADPKLMELFLLKSKIDSYDIHTVRKLLSKKIITDLEGEVGAIEYASLMYSQDSKMVELLQAYKEKDNSFKIEHSHNKKTCHIYMSKQGEHSKG